MSIILKGIDLPNGPIKLVLYPSGKVDEYVLNERIATDYQATQIPTPHGRIIDADKIMKDLEEWKQNPNNDDDAVVLVNHFQGIIRTEPTILEEEK